MYVTVNILVSYKSIEDEFFMNLAFCHQFQAELESHVRNQSDSELCGTIYREFEYYESSLSSSFDAFKKDTTDPVWNLR